MTSRTHPVKYTYEDYLRLPDDSKRYEIIDGDLYVTPSPRLRHQEVLGNLYAIIRAFVKATRAGKVYLAPTDVVFTNQDIVVPDLIFVSSSNFGVLTEKNVQGPPDLAVEVLSPSTRGRDQGIKRALYDRAGVREYWIVDPVEEILVVHRRTGSELAAVERLGKTETLLTALLPGLRLEIAEIFEE